jgi:hypothetical protein
MRYFRKRMRSRRFLLVCAAVSVVVLGGAAVVASGAYPTDHVTVYTGCLSKSGTSAGNISSVAASPTTPAKPCGSNQTLIHLSGGTITSVNPGTGLTGGGSDGSVTLADAADKTYTGADFATSGQDCAAGTFATGINATGGLNCAAPTIDDLQGSACTFNGHPSTLQVSTDSTSGAVSMTCTPVYEVSVTMTGLAAPSINIHDDTNNNLDNGCNALSCSTLVPSGDQVRMDFSSGSGSTGGGTPFTYTCPGESPQTAGSSPGFTSGTLYNGYCPVATHDATITADYAVTATASG